VALRKQGTRPYGKRSTLRAPGGFSLIELLVAIVLIAVGSLATIAMQPAAVKKNNLTDTRHTAAQLAREILETVRQTNSVLVQIRSGGAGGTVVQSAGLANFDCTVARSDTPFSFDGRGFLAAGSSMTLTITQPSLPASKTVLVNSLSKVSTP